MRFIDYILMAFRNIRRQKLRSALTIFAVVIGATSVTIMLSLVFSVKGFMTKQFEANGTLQQVRISPQTDISWQDNGGGNNCADCVKLTDDMVTKIEALTHVIGVARETHMGQFQALMYGSQKLRLNQTVAYDSNGIINSTMVAGRDINTQDTSGVAVITSDYADKLGFKGKYQDLIGKQVELMTQSWYTGVGSDPKAAYQQMQAYFAAHPNANGQDYQPAPTTLNATVIGIVDTTDDSYTVRVPLAWARGIQENQQYQVTKADQDAANAKCAGTRGPCSAQVQPSLTTTDMLAQNGYDSLTAKVDQASNAIAVTNEVKKLGLGAADAQSFIKSQLAIFNIIGAVLGGIGGIALAVAAVGVVNTMVMAILERTREIGVMRAVGARRSTVSRLFTIEAAVLGFLGGVLGLGVGYIMVLIANPIINKQLATNGIKSTNIIVLPLWLILSVVGVTTLIGLLAGLYPARRAAKLDPIEALHYE